MKRKHLSVLLAASMVVSMTACGQKAEEAAETTAAPTTAAATEAPSTEAATQPEEEGSFTAGTYTAASPAMKGELTVEVTFDGDGMTDIATIRRLTASGMAWTPRLWK